MNRLVATLVASLGLGVSLGSCTAPLPEEQTSTTTSFPAESTSYAVPIAGLEACKTELVKAAPAAESEFRIYDYEPRPMAPIWSIGGRAIKKQALAQWIKQAESSVWQMWKNLPPTTAETTPVTPGGITNPPGSTTAKSAVLSAADPGSEINVRSQPSVESDSPHYGVVGDKVQVLRETRGSDGNTWYFVKFADTEVEGWVRGDFIEVEGAAAAPSAPATRLQAETLIGMGKTEAIELAKLNGFNIVDESDPAMVLMSNTSQQLMLTVNSVDDTISNAVLR